MIHRFKRSEKGNCLKGMLIGCAIVALLIAMVMVGTFVYLKRHGAEFFSGLMTEFVDAALQESTLSESEQAAIKEEFARVTEKLKSGEITEEDMNRFGEAFAQGEVFYLIVLELIEDRWIPESGLSEEEKQAASLEIQRTKRGIVEGSFNQDQYVYIQKAMPMDNDEYGNEQLVENPTDEHVSNVVGDLKIVNDEAEIPEGEFTVNYATYVHSLVDKILGEETDAPEISVSTEEVMSATSEIVPASPAVE